MRQPRPAARFEATPAAIRRGAPQLGEHSDELLGELGLEADAIATLRSEGIIG
jgi:alpha-methylacyl-CoA racemase